MRPTKIQPTYRVMLKLMINLLGLCRPTLKLGSWFSISLITLQFKIWWLDWNPNFLLRKLIASTFFFAISSPDLAFDANRTKFPTIQLSLNLKFFKIACQCHTYLFFRFVNILKPTRFPFCTQPVFSFGRMMLSVEVFDIWFWTLIIKMAVIVERPAP